jgi:hypothetical protein
VVPKLNTEVSFAANAVRLQLHALAYNLGNFLRTLATPEPIQQCTRRSAAVAGVIEAKRRAIETVEHEGRLRKLEEKKSW